MGYKKWFYNPGIILAPDGQVNAILGQRVVRATEDCIDGGNFELFTVAGGKVLITAIVGEVTLGLVGAVNGNLMANPAVGANTNMCIATAINGDAIGTLYGITGVVGDAMSVTNGLAYIPNGNGVVVNVGTIDFVTNVNLAVNSIKWTLFYIPYDRGATVVAA